MNWRTLVAVAVAIVAAGAGLHLRARAAAGPITIRTLSTRPDRVSGGDVLIEVVAPVRSGRPSTFAEASADRRSLGGGRSGRPESPQVTLNGRDVSNKFHGEAGSAAYRAMIDGLMVGRNVVTVTGKPWGAANVSLELTNYPLSGPIVSGPHMTPFICQTEAFKLPDGVTLGAAKDADCTAAPVVQYVYLPKGAATFKPLASRTVLPDDVANTTTTTGRTVPFVVRVETGTINRAIYQIVVLHDVTKDAAPTAFAPPPGWNRRLIAVHGTGCPGGWYVQGSAMGVNPLTGANVSRLGEGYALFTSTLNHPSNSCNAFLAGETTMMVKERAIETLGVPEFTVSTGTSGGAYTSLQVADAFPGLFDGILINATFPDALSIALAGEDAHLLTHYFSATDPAGFTEAQQVAVSGYAGLRAWVDAANQAQRTDPVSGRADVPGYSPAVWNAAVPAAIRYDPGKNPKGARPTVFDAAKNIYGVDPATGFARRPFDNVGVQYGLNALNTKAITAKQFLDLNERIGGYDQDANYTPDRSAGDLTAITRAYQSGLTLGGGGGLASIPVFDDGAYNDTSAYHYQWFHFAIRQRLLKANGGHENHVMWRGPVQAARAWAVFVKWVAAASADRSSGTARERVIHNRPAEAVDGCWVQAEGAAPGAPPEFVAERQVFGRQTDFRCTTAFPSYGFTRLVAGGPLDANVLKCQLKKIDPSDYVDPMTASDKQRLDKIFPRGVCDWSKPGVGQVPVVTWNSFGPARPARH